MTKQELITDDGESDDMFVDKPWGEANPARGKSHSDHAKVFVRDHPVGTVLSADDLDAWMQKHELLAVPPDSAAKNSDAWLGHLQRRHIIRNRLNKAGSHPRMTDEGSIPFIIMAIRGGFEIRSPQVAITKSELPQKFKTLTETKRKQLAYLMQSADWSSLPPHERGIAETIYDDIDAFAEDVKISAERISRKLFKLEHRIRQGLEAGNIRPQNGGIRQLLAPLTSVDETG